MSQLTYASGQPLALDISPTIQELADKALYFGVRLVAFLAIVTVGALVAWGARVAIQRALTRLTFNKLAERTGLSRWAGRYSPSTLVAKLAGYTLLLITCQVAFQAFGPNPVSNLLDGLVAWLPRAFVALVIVLLAAAAGHMVFDLIATAAARLPYGRPAARTVQVAIVSLGTIAGLSQIGVAVALPILVALLATAGGVIVVGVGGGLIHPMRQRWERMLTRIDVERCRWSFELNRNVPRHTAPGTFPHSGSTGNAAAAGHATGHKASRPQEARERTRARQEALARETVTRVVTEQDIKATTGGAGAEPPTPPVS